MATTDTVSTGQRQVEEFSEWLRCPPRDSPQLPGAVQDCVVTPILEAACGHRTQLSAYDNFALAIAVIRVMLRLAHEYPDDEVDGIATRTGEFIGPRSSRIVHAVKAFLFETANDFEDCERWFEVRRELVAAREYIRSTGIRPLSPDPIMITLSQLFQSVHGFDGRNPRM